jgi:glutamate---cysteine ligase / carboxylate-amine ligase
MEHTTTTPAAEYTIGVEEEYQLVDAATGALRSHASRMRSEDWTGELIAELQETTVEIGTPICGSVAAAAGHLHRLRFQASTVANAQGLAIIAAGLHPFSEWQGHTRPQVDRYRAMEARYGRIARDEHIFGMHVHVAVPQAVDRIPIINDVRHYLPHLLALSASSPFFEGADTGFDSFRTIMWRRWPNSGIPPRFESMSEFTRYVDTLLNAGVMADPWNIYWSARPHPSYPTIEFRVTDACPNLQDALAIVALARALVHAAATGVLPEDPASRLSPVTEQELLRVNEWRAARDGLSAQLIDTLSGSGHAPIRSLIRRLTDRVSRSAEELGDTEALAHIDTLLERGNAAARLRRRFDEAGTLTSLVEWLIDESSVGTGLDRRSAQRGGS